LRWCFEKGSEDKRFRGSGVQGSEVHQHLAADVTSVNFKVDFIFGFGLSGIGGLNG